MKRERPVGGRRIFPSVLEKLRQKVVFLSYLIGYTMIIYSQFVVNYFNCVLLIIINYKKKV
jgi:hypothetical protein